MTDYLALLRGINVGGRNLIPMADLRARCEALGLAEVETYIQSGNVLFLSEADTPSLVERLEAELSRAFAYESSVVLRTREELRGVVEGAPAGFGSQPDVHRCDVLFLKEPLTATEALESVTAGEGVDTVEAGPGVLYFSRRIDQASRSHLARLTSKPIYRRLTIRNWNTTTRLDELMAERARRRGAS